MIMTSITQESFQNKPLCFVKSYNGVYGVDQNEWVLSINYSLYIIFLHIYGKKSELRWS